MGEVFKNKKVWAVVGIVIITLLGALAGGDVKDGIQDGICKDYVIDQE